MMNRFLNFAFNFKLRRYNMNAQDVSNCFKLYSKLEASAAAAGTDGCCSPRHVIPFNSRNEGLQCGRWMMRRAMGLADNAHHVM